MRHKKTVKMLFPEPPKLYERFHTKTKIKKLSSIDPLTWPQSWKTVYFKAYGRMPEITLPKPQKKLGSFNRALAKRKSEREFSKIPLSLKDISTLFYYSLGIREKKSDWQGNRFYPSAGARYPIEAYFIPLNSELSSGVYHYYIKNHTFEHLISFPQKDIRPVFNQDWIFKAGGIMVLTAQFKRTAVKYGDRGYRHVLIEAGHIGQNIYLTATATGISCCSVGGYVDQKLETLLDIDGVSEAVVYVVAIGKNISIMNIGEK